MFRASLFAALLAPTLVVGCVTPDDDVIADDAVSASEQALTGGLRLDRRSAFAGGDAFRPFADISGDGKGDFEMLDTLAPRQWGIVGVTGGAFAASVAVPTDVALDGGSFVDSSVVPIGDVTGDGRGDLVQRSSTLGLRILQRTSTGGLTGTTWYPWGTRVNGWLIGNTDAVYGGADVDGDGKNELLITSAWGIASFRVDTTGHLSAYNIVQRGQYLAGDRFYLDGSTTLVGRGRYWGGAEELLLLRSTAGFGMAWLPPDGSTPVVIDYAPFGEMQKGGWRVGSGDRLVGSGDVNGDGREDFVLWSPWGLGVLDSGDWFSSTTSFDTVGAFVWGTPIDGVATTVTSWNDGDAVDDFDGDGRADIAFVDSTGRLVVLGFDPATRTLVPRATLKKGQTARGGWIYDGATPTETRVGRFETSSRAAVLEDSGWGLGVLAVDAGGFYVAAAAPFEVACGDFVCEGGESCSTCSNDCGTCPAPVETCGNGVCRSGETCSSCPGDCGPCPPPPPPTDTCGNGVCGPSETCGTCPWDCGTDYDLCQWCPTGAGYKPTPVTKRACSLDAAYSAATAALACTGGSIAVDKCPGA